MISENKLKHSLGVARQCEALANENGMTEEAQMACFVMGFLHDIGYESASEITKHPVESGNYIDAFLKHKDLCVDAIKNHGKRRDDFSVFDIILNTADLTVNYEGSSVSVNDRLEGIKQRHGEDSIHYQHAVEIGEYYGIK